MTRELRALQLDRLVLRADDGDDGTAGGFTGHATVWNTRYAVGDPKTWGWWEEFDFKSVDRALREEQPVALLRDHDPSKLLATTKAGTMTLSKDKRGLAVDADIPDTTDGRDVQILMQRGDLDSMSLAFIVKSEAITELDDGSVLRTILDVDLYDVSIVTYPANPETDAALRCSSSGLADFRKQRHAEARARFDRLPAQWGRA